MTTCKNIMLGCFAVLTFGANAQEARDAGDSVRVLLLPEFYHQPITEDDTTFSYEIYGKDDKQVSVNTLADISDVEHILFVKSYTLKNDGPLYSGAPCFTHTVVFFNNIGNNTWGVKNKDTQEYYQLNEDRNTIVRSDTISFSEPATGKTQRIN